MYERLPDELTCPQEYETSIVINTNTQVYDLPVVTTDISVNTNSANITTTNFREAQQTDSSHTYVNVVDQQPDSSHTYVNVVDQQPDSSHTYVNVVAKQPDTSHTYVNIVDDSDYML